MYSSGDWVAIEHTGQAARVLESSELWGTREYQLWIPELREVRRLPEHAITRDEVVGSPTRLVFTSAAAKVADAVDRRALLAPLESCVTPLPHQVLCLSRAVAREDVRYLLADEVGLGKTIEAGLVLRELKARGLVRRTLVVAPTGLTDQWQSEMRTHFSEDFRIVVPGEFANARRFMGLDETDNLWRVHDQVIAPLDSIKPLDARRGWSDEQLERYNRERFEDVVSAGWDLIVIDEAHRVGGSTEQVARHQLGVALAQASPYLLLLTATPHQGKTDGFRRVMSLIDSESFRDDESVTRDAVAPYVIRTEKRKAIDAEGRPLFMPRRTQLVPVTWGDAHAQQQALYDSVTEYAREGYNRALREKSNAAAFLMILMQRLVTSSTRAIRVTLQKRLEVLALPDGQLTLFPEDVEEWDELDGQEQLNRALSARLKGLGSEHSEVELLLAAARRCEATSPDAKAMALADHIGRARLDFDDRHLKVLVFTEFVATQQMLAEYLEQRGYTIATLNGSMGQDERIAAQKRFAREADVLISTDAGGEGLNLQFCNVVVNYDLPWNPMKIEQRIGRVDRIGQVREVLAINFELVGTVEMRVREVLEEKLARILEDFGVDKLSDVLDTEGVELDFDRLYTGALRDPRSIEREVRELAQELLERTKEAREGMRILESADVQADAAARLLEGQIPIAVRTMTLSHLTERGSVDDGDSEQVYRLGWPDGSIVERAVFDNRLSQQFDDVTLVGLDDARVRGLLGRVVAVVDCGRAALIRVSGVSDVTSGVWALWRIGLQDGDSVRQRFMPVFLDEAGRFLEPTARLTWETISREGPKAVEALGETEIDEERFHRLRERAERDGRLIYQELVREHREGIERDRRRTEAAFAARERASARIGLQNVREARVRDIALERAAWQAQQSIKSEPAPILECVAIAVVAPALGAS